MAARVKIVRRPELTFWEKLYIPQILCGLKITFKHFFRNLFLHIAHRVGLRRHIRAAATIQYPEELRPLMSRFRSRHRLTVRVRSASISTWACASIAATAWRSARKMPFAWIRESSTWPPIRASKCSSISTSS
jgi:formate hydrogenlyase subunit 6/NADH:ubiquinone oxidoreductase subunit I